MWETKQARAKYIPNINEHDTTGKKYKQKRIHKKK